MGGDYSKPADRPDVHYDAFVAGMPSMDKKVRVARWGVLAVSTTVGKTWKRPAADS